MAVVGSGEIVHVYQCDTSQMDAGDSHELSAISSSRPSWWSEARGLLDIPTFFFAMIRKMVKAKSHLWLKVLMIHCRPLHIQKEIWGTGKDAT